ncbi:hypothetical protein CUMW_163670 [Citrus unshiu]|nr:hypothetical protein CUMW_163670 [Citrus unshiu]
MSIIDEDYEDLTTMLLKQCQQNPSKACEDIISFKHALRGLSIEDDSVRVHTCPEEVFGELLNRRSFCWRWFLEVDIYGIATATNVLLSFVFLVFC